VSADLNASLECHSFPDVDSTATKTTPSCEQHWPEPSPSFFYTFVTFISQPQTYECRQVGWKSQKAQIGSIKVISLRHHPALSIGWVSLLTSATNSSSKVKSPVSIPRFSFFLIIFTYAKLFYSTDTKNETLSIIIILVVWKSNENCYDDSEALNRRQSLDYAVNPPSIFYNSQKKR